MSKIDLMKKMLSDLLSDPRKARSNLTEDCMFSGPVPEPIGADEFIQVMKSLTKAFPDWNFNAKDFREEGGKVSGVVQITCTHNGVLQVMDLPSVPPTGKKINIPRETITLSFKGDKISEIKVTKVPGGGVLGAYKQVGVDVSKPVLA
jgi:predicted ester cyclase